MKNVKETKKLNNKGFSLVELIIVVAIMAVLIGVLAPQYLKYVEKSRESADLDNIQTVISAIEVYYTDPANSMPASSLSFSTDADNKLNTSAFKEAMTNAGLDTSKIEIKSNAYKGKVEVTLNVDNTKGNIYFTAKEPKLANALGIATTSTPTP